MHESKLSAPRTPPSPAVLRRRMVLMEAGLEHEEVARWIETRDGVSTGRTAVTGVVNGRWPSKRIADGIVECVRERLVALGKSARAREVSLKYLGWDEPEVAAAVG